MCLIVEIAMTLWGIVTLVRGKFPLSRNKIVTGRAAYLVGLILTSTVPATFGVGFAFGLYLGSQGVDPDDMDHLIENTLIDVGMELALVIAVMSLTYLVAFSTAKEREQAIDIEPMPESTGPTSYLSSERGADRGFKI